MNKELIINGSKIFCRVSGNGKPVLFVHGFGETGEIWNNQIAFLQDSFQLIVPDLPGSGQSELIEDMSMEGMAEILKLILDKEAIAQTTMIGHSMGGYITLAFVQKHTDRLTAFGLFHSTAFADTEEKKTTRQKGIDFVRQHGAYEFLKTTIPNLFSSASKEKNPTMINEFILGLNNFSAEAIVSYYKAMMKRPDRTELLKATSLPVLFVIGEYDTAVPVHDSLKLTHLPEKSYIHILHQSGHMGMLEEENKSNEAVKNFLSETNHF